MVELYNKASTDSLDLYQVSSEWESSLHMYITIHVESMKYVCYNHMCGNLQHHPLVIFNLDYCLVVLVVGGS